MKVGDRVRTPEGADGRIVSMRKAADRATGFGIERGEWEIVVRLDGGARRVYLARRVTVLER